MPFFFQLYVNKDRAPSEAPLKDAENDGIKGVWFTIDGPVQGKREGDERVKVESSTYAKAKHQLAAPLLRTTRKVVALGEQRALTSTTNSVGMISLGFASLRNCRSLRRACRRPRMRY